MRARGFTVGMRALLLRRTGFLATLATGLGLVATGVLGLSGIDRDLELAATDTRPAPALVADRGWDCDGHRDWRRT